MSLKRYFQTRLKVAIVCVVHFVLTRTLGEVMASGILEIGHDWHRARQRDSVID